MGRSVNYLSRAIGVTYFNSDSEDEFTFEDLRNNIEFALTDKYPSLSSSKGRWDGREVAIILENNHCEIGISEYCGLVSVSIRVNSNDHPELSESWIEKVWPNMVKTMKENTYHDNLSKVATFSNGEAVYELS